jgi:hypothetical protein
METGLRAAVKVHHLRIPRMDIIRDDLVEERPENLARADQHQVIERPGICDNAPHAISEAEPLQIAALSFEILYAVGLVHLVRLQEPVELVTRRQAENAAQPGFGQMTELEFFKRQRLERAAFDVAGRADQPGESRAARNWE